MRHRGVLVVLALFALLTAGAGEKHSLVDSSKAEGVKRREFLNLLVLAITDDREARRNFENKFVSHLRGRGTDGFTSHTLSADLGGEGNGEAIVQMIHDEGIDGVISVRVVPLKGIKEPEWGAAWSEAMQSEGDLRQLINDSLPVADAKGKKFGIEVALWETDGWTRIWGARTNPYTRGEMRSGSSEFVRFVMYELERDGLLEPATRGDVHGDR